MNTALSTGWFASETFTIYPFGPKVEYVRLETKADRDRWLAENPTARKPVRRNDIHLVSFVASYGPNMTWESSYGVGYATVARA